MVQGQFHEKFKSFAGSSLTELAHEIRGFLDGSKSAAKSISVVPIEQDYCIGMNLISHTKTSTGLYVEASLDYADYEKGIKVSAQEMEHLNLKHDPFHGEWNYRLTPTRE